MAADGSNGPRPWTQRRASTVFLRVPVRDWPAVKRGLKTEFRSASGRVPQLWNLSTPAPVVGYTVRNGRHDSRLLVLERFWQEPLGAISADSLAREGFETLADFRRYWMLREGRRFRPTRDVFVYRVRPLTAADVEPVSGRLFRHLYGDFLDDELVAA